MHTRLPEGKPVFIDANIFLNAILGNANESAPCVRFLEAVDKDTVHGATSIIVMNEVLHRLLIASVVSDYGINPESAVHFFKTNPSHVRNATKVWDLMDDIRNIRTLKIHGIYESTFSRSLTLMQESGLLSNDALHVASMEEQSIDTIATYDRDFERVPQIKVWKPAKAV